MKDQALQIVRNESNPRLARNILREYLQHVILRQLFEQNLLKLFIFHGGTALRVLHNVRRFSEDLDFHLIYPDQSFNLNTELDSLRHGLELSGYYISFKKRTDKTVQSVLIKFEELLYDFSLTSHKTENLNVKIEIDANPPAGFQTETTLVNKYFPFAVKHHNVSTFFAGKLHAIFQRKYPKGRDFYDFSFYITRWKDIQPNFIYLNNALLQTGYAGTLITINNWEKLLMDKIKYLNWDRIKEDVEPFIEQENNLILLQKEYLIDFLKRRALNLV